MTFSLSLQQCQVGYHWYYQSRKEKTKPKRKLINWSRITSIGQAELWFESVTVLPPNPCTLTPCPRRRPQLVSWDPPATPRWTWQWPICGLARHPWLGVLAQWGARHIEFFPWEYAIQAKEIEAVVRRRWAKRSWDFCQGQRSLRSSCVLCCTYAVCWGRKPCGAQEEQESSLDDGRQRPYGFGSGPYSVLKSLL